MAGEHSRLACPGGGSRYDGGSAATPTQCGLIAAGRMPVRPVFHTLTEQLLADRNCSPKPWSPSAVREGRSEQNRPIACDFRHLQPCPGPSHHGLTEQLHRDSWPGPNGDHAPERHGRAVHCRGRQFRFPHRRRDLRSLRGKTVQAAFRGVLLCQGVRKRSLPGKARGFRGGRTPSNAMTASVSSWRRSTSGSRKTRPPTAAK